MKTGFAFDDFYEDVIDRVGGEQSTAEDVIRVRRAIRIVLERWEAQQFNTWRVRNLTTFASGLTPSIALPENVDDVLHVLVDGKSEITRYSPARYMKIADKDRTGRPSGFYLSREEPPRLYLHPAGDGSRLEVWFVERPEGFDPTRDTLLDVPGRWLEALVLAVSHDVARKRPREGGAYDEGLIQRLNLERLEAEDIARRADRDRSRFRFRM